MMTKNSSLLTGGYMPRAALTAAALLWGLGAASLTLAQPSAQSGSSTKSASAKKWKVPRTADGHPDLQGIWNNATITPFERPNEFGERRALTPAEAAKLEQAEADFVAEGSKPTDPSKGIQDLPVNCRPGFSGTNCGYNNFWVDSGTQVVRVDGEMRTSILTDPPNGKMPPLTPEGQKRRADRFAALRSRGPVGPADGPEIRSLGERCLTSFGSSSGPPMLPLMYNNNYQIVQTKDHVMILVEMVHDARIIRLNAQPAPPALRKWMGDSVGRWEGDTLVIETTNINPLQSFRGATPNAKITERLTRVAPNQIRYQFTVDDPSAFASPFSGELNMNASNEPIFEYACHEGNYALPGILAGAREEERAAAEKAAAAKPAAAMPAEGKVEKKTEKKSQ